MVGGSQRCLSGGAVTVLFSTCVPLLIFKSVRVFSQLHLRSRPARPAAGAPRGAAHVPVTGVRTPPLERVRKHESGGVKIRSSLRSVYPSPSARTETQYTLPGVGPCTACIARCAAPRRHAIANRPAEWNQYYQPAATQPLGAGRPHPHADLLRPTAVLHFLRWGRPTG